MIAGLPRSYLKYLFWYHKLQIFIGYLIRILLNKNLSRIHFFILHFIFHLSTSSTSIACHVFFSERQGAEVRQHINITGCIHTDDVRALLFFTFLNYVYLKMKVSKKLTLNYSRGNSLSPTLFQINIIESDPSHSVTYLSFEDETLLIKVYKYK